MTSPSWEHGKTGSDLIADFVAHSCHPEVFLVNGGACAFIIDALGRHAHADFVCMQHEQAAAMAADAIFRVSGKVGVSVATSGPGATNLITGIASSWFDSIPSLHITGQVNDRESKATVGADVRQSGFQETDIVAMVSTITKFAVKVASTSELALALRTALETALEGRMGPVLVDVPMNVQQDPVTSEDYALAFAPKERPSAPTEAADLGDRIDQFLQGAARPLVILGGGLGLAGTSRMVQDWCESHNIPYIASWAGLTYLDRSLPGYQGSQGVYGSRHANWCVQAADRILVLGSRLDNRQRTGRVNGYAPFASLFVVDVDPAEIDKFKRESRYQGAALDLQWAPEFLGRIDFSYDSQPWRDLIDLNKAQSSSGWEASVSPGEFNPYEAVAALQRHFKPGSIVAADTGATLCWLFQAYGADDSFAFTAGGNSPMGYSLPAAIGAQLARPNSPVVCVIGDGGFQMNLQELQTAVAYNTPITIIVFNNAGYGIIKQFQDSNTAGRHFASGIGYTVPDFGRIASAYGIRYAKVESLADIDASLFDRELKLVELVIPPGALITPKVDGDHFLHDQFPYEPAPGVGRLPYDYPERPSLLPPESGATG